MTGKEEMKKESKSDECSSTQVHALLRQDQASEPHGVHQLSHHTPIEVATQRLRQKFFEARLQLLNRDDAIERLKSDIMRLREQEDELLEMLKEIWQERKRDAQQTSRSDLMHETKEDAVSEEQKSKASRSVDECQIHEAIGIEPPGIRPIKLQEPVKRPVGPSPEEQERRAGTMTNNQSPWLCLGKIEQRTHQRTGPDGNSPRKTSSNLREPILGGRPLAVSLEKRDGLAVWPTHTDCDMLQTEETIFQEKPSKTLNTKLSHTSPDFQKTQSVKPKRVSFSSEAFITGRLSLGGADADNEEKIKVGSRVSRGAKKTAARPTGLRKKHGSTKSSVSVVDGADSNFETESSKWKFPSALRRNSVTPFDPRKTLR